MEGYGKNIRLIIEGSSHGPYVSMTLTGLPTGEQIDRSEIRDLLKRRSPKGNGLSTERKEPDDFTLSGLDDMGRTTLSPVTAVIKNTDVKKEDYEKFKYVPRPGHADFTAHIKYDGKEDMSGGGRFSGRMTAPLCIGGSICMQILKRKGITFSSEILSVGNETDKEKFECAVKQAYKEGDSLGGVIRCTVKGIPAGIGGPLFEGLEGRISNAVFGIPGVKGIGFGSGFEAAKMKGSENNDGFTVVGGKPVTAANRCGGILGGISTGGDLVFDVAFKPTPSIRKPQESINLITLEKETISIEGRHDSCIAMRACPVVEAATAVALLDAVIDREKEISNGLDGLRKEIDSIDLRIITLLEERFAAAEKIAAVKENEGIPVTDANREEAVLERARKALNGKFSEVTEDVFKEIIKASKKVQTGAKGGGHD